MLLQQSLLPPGSQASHWARWACDPGVYDPHPAAPPAPAQITDILLEQDNDLLLKLLLEEDEALAGMVEEATGVLAERDAGQQ
jgi:hypothetical protein